VSNTPPFRTNMSGSSDAPEIRRSQDVWYDDGNLVVRAENTLFRVYGGLIAAQSTVFADMLKMPAEPDGAQETVEGCPVVRVHDPAEDICRLLRAIHDPQCATSFALSPLTRC
jgi:hypothetical protein